MHPVTGLRLPAACGSTTYGNGTYSRLKAEASCDDGFVPYVPLADKPLVPSGASAERKRWLMRGRLLCKIGKEAAELRRRRRKVAKLEVREVIRSFMDGAGDDVRLPGESSVLSRLFSGCDVAEEHTSNLSGLGGEQVVPAPGDDNSDEEFWSNLPSVDSRAKRLLSIPSGPDRSFPGKAVRSRVATIERCGEALRKGV